VQAAEAVRPFGARSQFRDAERRRVRRKNRIGADDRIEREIGLGFVDRRFR
jgi:hypothetical protein